MNVYVAHTLTVRLKRAHGYISERSTYTYLYPCTSRASLAVDTKYEPRPRK
jgi:hypothetical protein